MIGKKYYLLPKIISLLWMLCLISFSTKVKAISTISINLQIPTQEIVINDGKININGEIKSNLKLKSVCINIDNDNIGQASLNELQSEEKVYITRLQYSDDISFFKDGEYKLKIVAIDEEDNKEEKSLNIYIKNQQKQIKEDTTLKNGQNNTLSNYKYKETKVLSVPLSGRAKIQTYDIMLGSQYITSGKLVSGKTYTIKGYASSPNGVLYELWVKEVSTGVWTKVRDYKEDRYANWTPNKSGQYVIGVNVKDKYSSTSSMDGRVEKTFTVESQSGKAKIQTYDIMSGSQYITSGKLVSGKTYTIKGYASSPNGVLYEFWVKEVSTGVWTKVRDYKEDRYANWTPNKSGQYVIGVNVKDKYSSTSSMDGRVEKTFTVESQSAKAKIQTYDIMLGSQYITNSKLVSGKTYTIKGYASSPNGVLYEFWVKEVSTGVWKKIRDYKEDRYANWTPNKSGQYVIGVNVKDKYSSTSSMDGRVEKTFTVESQSGKAKIQTYDIMLGSQYITNSKLVSGKTYTIKGYASSPNGVLYEFWVKEVSTGVWKKIRDYKEDRYANWTPNKSGQYVIGVNVKDKYSSTSSMDGRVEKTFTIESQSGKAKIQTYDIMLGNEYITSGKLVSGKTYTIKGYASSPNGLLYEFWVKDLNTGVLTKIRDYNENRYANWTSTKSGKYTIIVKVKDIFSSNIFDSKIEKIFTVLGENGLIQNYKKTYYNITLEEMINKQILATPAYHMYIPEKNIYQWIYAIVKNNKKGYSTDINGVNWIQSDQQYDYIKSKVREYIDPTNQIYDSSGQYQFLQLSYNDCTTAEQLNKVLKYKGVLQDKGQVFIDSARESNISPIYLVAHALLETGNGTSTLAKGVVVNGKPVYNLFGIHAVDSDPTGQGSKYAYEQGWFSVDLAIKGGAKWISAGYINNVIYKQDTLYKMRWNPSNPTVHQYATDIRWVYNQIGNIKKVIDELQGTTLNLDIPIFK